jgi:4-amino-4-deoxy-L-arabinose transferase-like glycosyltransferase
MPTESARVQRLRDAALIALFAGFLFLYGMSGRTLRESSEGRVARVAQEMLDTGDWVVPHLNGQARLQKPPLSSWLVAVSAKLFSQGRVTAWDALLPQGLAAVLLVVLVYVWLSRGGEEGARASGMFAALALATMPGFLAQARSAEMDMLLALATALAFLGYERHRLGDRRAGLLVFYAALGAGFLVKGPVIFVFVLPPLLAWRNWTPRSEAQPAAVPGRWTLHLLGLAILLVMVLSWGIPYLLRSGFTWGTFHKEFFSRFGEEAGHNEPWHYYLGQVPAWLLPWTVLLPFVAWWQWKSPAPEASPRRRLWWLWLGVNFLVWSVVSSKQRHYALPWLTPAALLVGDGVMGMAREASGELSAKACAVWGRRVAMALGLLMAAGLLAAAAKAPRGDVPGALVWTFAGVGALAFVCGALALGLGQGRGLFESWWAGALCAMLLYVNTFEAVADQETSPVAFCGQVRDAVPAGAKLYDAGLATRHSRHGTPDFRRANILFYLGRNVAMVDLSATPAPKELTDKEAEAWMMDRLTAAVAGLLQEGSSVYVLAPAPLRERLREGSYDEPFPGQATFVGHRWGAHLLQGKARAGAEP